MCIRDSINRLYQKHTPIMREIITLHIGQCGIQVGAACWELFCREHGLLLDGTVESTGSSNAEQGFRSVFSEAKSGRFAARAVFADLEQSVIEEVKSGELRGLFGAKQFIGYKEDTGNLYSCGKYCNGRQIYDPCIDQIRKLAEDCAELQGFVMFHSIGGGTGSGFGSLLLEALSQLYPKKPKHSICIFPSPNTTAGPLERYNAMLALPTLIKHVDTALMFDNEAAHCICEELLCLDAPDCGSVNRLVAQTVSLAIGGGLSLDGELGMLQSDLVAYPDLHFVVPSFAPFTPVSQTFYQIPSVLDVTDFLFESSHTMLTCNLNHGKNMSLRLGYRGDITLSEAKSAITAVKAVRYIPFIPWLPGTMGFSVQNWSPVFVSSGDLAKTPRTACKLSNNTAMGNYFTEFSRKYNDIRCKRAFAFWYCNSGMEEGEFSESREIEYALECDYEELESKK
eukprot:TRINITY_DN4145_c0_g1_i6.p1 TRINITY_DN4145_c0_g1~~TRINITY_DN4145_c0_g1_i6.p1  ORF type:complete len:453 (+),score=64.74 TRINITY_DN4145_c0_g1_i6:91-1449(+)